MRSTLPWMMFQFSRLDTGVPPPPTEKSSEKIGRADADCDESTQSTAMAAILTDEDQGEGVSTGAPPGNMSTVNVEVGEKACLWRSLDEDRQRLRHQGRKPLMWTGCYRTGRRDTRCASRMGTGREGNCAPNAGPSPSSPRVVDRIPLSGRSQGTFFFLSVRCDRCPAGGHP